MNTSPLPSPALTIIIVSYNVSEDLRECLQSIAAAGFDGGLEVIVVDNASSDGTLPMLRREFPGVELIVNEENVGFPKANNQGLARARGRISLYLNPDTVVMPGTLQASVTYLREHENVGLLGCMVRYPDGRIQYECARNEPSLDALVWEALYLHLVFPRSRWFGKTLMSYWDHEGSCEVPCLLGAFMMGPTTMLAALGGMDESVFMFMEDIDLCYRVRQAGRKVFYLADVSIVHKSGRSQKHYRGSLMSTNAEAKYAFFRKHGGIGAAAACRAIFLMEGLFRVAVSLLLYPVVAVFPRAKQTLRGAWVTREHWRLVRWALGARTSPEGAR